MADPITPPVEAPTESELLTMKVSFTISFKSAMCIAFVLKRMRSDEVFNLLTEIQNKFNSTMLVTDTATCQISVIDILNVYYILGQQVEHDFHIINGDLKTALMTQIGAKAQDETDSEHVQALYLAGVLQQKEAEIDIIITNMVNTGKQFVFNLTYDEAFGTNGTTNNP